ncbi:MAG TPA: ABC transporter ATP-binding protein [Alphaproteobacteria bacterium]|jgi:branched-chain amino acid transport system ATP-binding protein|nr:ABC transporter ATP-binding protein [Alphaproteobacteria bacterium]
MVDINKQEKANILALKDVHSFYGQVEALRGVSLQVKAGEIVSLIGANGAGKTTLLMTICGKPKAQKGEIIFLNQSIVSKPTHEIIRLGIAHCPEGRHIFPKMTVMENLLMGIAETSKEFFKQDLKRIFDLFPILYDRRTQRGGTLSGGEQQMLAIGRAIISRPKLLLLDEPSLGLAPIIVQKIFATVRQLNKELQMTILLIEQNAYHALQLADRAYVLVNGYITMQGTGQELLTNPEISKAYLGG